MDTPEDLVINWQEANAADDGSDIVAEQLAEARYEQHERHAIVTSACPACGAQPAAPCLRDTHPERFHAASVPCGVGCPKCPRPIPLTPDAGVNTGRKTHGRWSSTPIRIDVAHYNVRYTDPLVHRLAAWQEHPTPGPYVTLDFAPWQHPRPHHPTVEPGTTILVDGGAYRLDDTPYAWLPEAPIQPPRPNDLTPAAATIANNIDQAMEHIDQAARALDAVRHNTPAPGTPTATLATMAERLNHAQKDLTAIYLTAQALTDPDRP